MPAADRDLQAFRRPIIEGWRLWWRTTPQLGLHLLPVGLVIAGLTALSGGTAFFEPLAEGAAEAQELALPDLGIFLALAYGVALMGVVLSQAHTGHPAGSPHATAMRRFVPWLVAWIGMMLLVLVGFLLLIVPGVVAGVRFFWADEFVLVHRQGPFRALRASFDLTRGAGLNVFGFQFLAGFASYVVLIPGILAVVLLGAQIAPLAGTPAGDALLSTILSVVGLVLYASVHAPEVVYFYGLQAARERFVEGELPQNWVERARREVAREGEP